MSNYPHKGAKGKIRNVRHSVENRSDLFNKSVIWKTEWEESTALESKELEEHTKSREWVFCQC